MSLASGLSQLQTVEGHRGFEVTVATQTAAGQFDDAALPFKVVRGLRAAELRKLIRAADAVHVAGPALAPMFWSWWIGKPYVIEHHGYQAICPNGLLFFHPQKSVCPGHFQAHRYFQCLRCNTKNLGAARSLALLCRTFPRRWLSRRAAANVAVSSHVMRRHALPQSALCYHGVEDPLETGEPENGSAAAKGIECFAYVGRLVEEKGLPLLIEAAKQLRKEGFRFLLRFIGDGPERRKLEDTSRDAGLTETGSVEFTGFLRGAPLRKSLRTAHAVVMPSIWEETAGLAAIDQMMLGRLVIAADIGGLGEVVGDTGLKFEPGSSERLAACMRQVLQNPFLIGEMGKRGRERALQLFQRQRMVNEHAAIYRQTVARSRMKGKK
jgi:glycosyltransferase involved in cell wall biosynthesis